MLKLRKENEELHKENLFLKKAAAFSGYPYDNAPMERYFNTLKNECTNLYEFRTEEALYQTVEEFTGIKHPIKLELHKSIFFSHKCYKNA